MPSISNLADYGMIAGAVKDDVLTPQESGIQRQQLGSLALGNRGQEIKLNQAQSQIDGDARLKQIIQKNSSVDPTTNQVKINHPQVAADLANSGDADKARAYMDQQHQATYEQHKGQMEQIAQIANGILSVPIESRAAAYNQELAGLKQRGVDITGAPEQYGPGTDDFLTKTVNSAVDAKTHFESLGKSAERDRKIAADEQRVINDDRRADSMDRRTDSMDRRTDAIVDGVNNKIELTNAPNGGKPLKPIPPAAQKAIIENAETLKNIQDAITFNDGGEVGGLKGSKEASGLIKGITPNFLLNRADPDGNVTRSAIADLKSMYIHDRSGAAVTLNEMKILKPFLPNFDDDQPVIKEKLTRLKQIIAHRVSLYAETYNSDNGYRDSSILTGNPNEKPLVAANEGGGEVDSASEIEALRSELGL